MTCVVKVKCRDWKFYWFLTPERTFNHFRIFAARFDEKEAQAFVDRNRARNPDTFFRIEPL